MRDVDIEHGTLPFLEFDVETSGPSIKGPTEYGIVPHLLIGGFLWSEKEARWVQLFVHVAGGCIILGQLLSGNRHIKNSNLILVNHDCKGRNDPSKHV